VPGVWSLMSDVWSMVGVLTCLALAATLFYYMLYLFFCYSCPLGLKTVLVYVAQTHLSTRWLSFICYTTFGHWINPKM